MTLPHPTSPQISVIIPVYNGGRFVAAAIDSVRAQTCDGWELVVVNDGSTDGTAAVLAGYAGDGRIRVLPRRTRASQRLATVAWH